jgi:hypothetical protein
MLRNGLKSVFILSLLAVFVFAATAARAEADPVDSFKMLGKTAQDGDWGAFWDGCEESTQQTLSKIFMVVLAFSSLEDPNIQTQLEEKIGPPPEDFNTMVFNRDQFVAMMAMIWEMADEGETPVDVFNSTGITEKERQKDRAILEVQAEGKTPEEVVMLLRGGAWKYYLADPFQELPQGTGDAPQAGAAAAESPAPAAGEPGEQTQKAKDMLKQLFK